MEYTMKRLVKIPEERNLMKISMKVRITHGTFNLFLVGNLYISMKQDWTYTIQGIMVIPQRIPKLIN